MRQLSMKYVGGRLPVRENEGYRIRNYCAEDYEKMLDALTALTIKRYTSEELDSVILCKKGARPESVFVADDGNKLLGTATGYTHEPDGDKPGDDGGTLHMVSALTEAAGRGVGTAVCTAAVNYLLDSGCSYVDLTTDDFRLNAIVVYTKLGFRPVIDDDEMQQRWSALAEKLGRPELIGEAWRL